MRQLLLPVALAALVACSANDPIHCSEDADCHQGGIAGFCTASTGSSDKWCAFSDVNCPGTQLRWGARAGDDLARECVAGEGGGEPVAVTVTLEGEGSGTIVSTPAGIDCGTTCTHEFPAGTMLKLTATEHSGSFFEGWGGGCSGNDIDCAVSLGAPTAVNAKFLRTGSTRWLKQLGTTTDGFAQAAGVAKNGDIVVAGVGELAGHTGVIVRALSGSDGTTRWTKVFDTVLGFAKVSDLGIDANGNVVVAGVLDSQLLFDGTTISPPPGGGTAAAGAVFLAKLSGTDGGVQWAQAIGHVSIYAKAPQNVAIAGDGDIYLSSGFDADFTLGGTPFSQSDLPVFLARFTPAGVVTWARGIGGEGVATIRDLLVDPDASLTIVGDFDTEIDLPGVNNVVGNSDVFVAKLSTSSAEVLLSDFTRGEGAERAVGLDQAGSGSTLVLGTYEGALDLGDGPLPGGKGFFIMELSIGGAHLGSFGVAGPGVIPRGLVLGPRDEGIWVIGTFSGTVSVGGPELTPSGGEDGFFAKYSRNGAHVYSTRFGGTDKEIGQFAIATDNAVVLGGQFETFAEFGEKTLTGPNAGDGFVWKIVP